MPKINTSTGAGFRFDETTTAVRSYFNQESDEVASSEFFSNSAVSDEFLASNTVLFNLEGIELVLTDEKEGSSQTTCKYEQYLNSIPVYGAYLNVTMRNSDRSVTSSINRIEYGLPASAGQQPFGLSSAEVLTLIHQQYDSFYQVVILTEPTLYIFKRKPVWRLEMDTVNPTGYWELLMDATGNHEILKLDRRRFVTGKPAKVFWPDPITSSQNPRLHWGSPESVLNSEMVDVLLENLNETGTPATFLKGKWVHIAEIEDPGMDIPSGDAKYAFSSKDRNLLSVMAYYYIDRLVEWIRSLEIPLFDKNFQGPVLVDAQAVGRSDNSHFVVPVNGPVYIGFGEGGTPDASDPGVIVHEFGHALHYFLLGKFNAAGSFEEGFNDFLSCVFRDRFNVHGYDRANPFPWDNNSHVNWDPERRCDIKLHFDDPAYKKYGLYKKGSVYASALWEIFLEIGGKSGSPEVRMLAAGEITGTCLDMLIAVGDTGPITDLVNGLISSDYCRTGGRLGKVIREVFARRRLDMS